MRGNFSRLFYRETIRGTAVGDERIIRQSGAMHDYAHVRVTVQALGRGEGVICIWSARGDIPAKFVGAVTEGVENALNAGVLAGLVVTDIQVSIESGSYHDVDSNTDAFREAAEKAVTAAIKEADPVILEALVEITVFVPQKVLSVVEGILTARSRKNKPKHLDLGAAQVSVSAIFPASKVPTVMRELLEATSEIANLTSRIVAFRIKSEPPDSIHQWVEST